jgi:hypothetical protein
VLALRHTAAVMRLLWHDVALKHEDLVEMWGESPCRAETGDTPAKDDSSASQAHGSSR